MTTTGLFIIVNTVQIRNTMTTQKLTNELKHRIKTLFSTIHGLTFTATTKQIKKVYPKFDGRKTTHWYTLVEYLLKEYDAVNTQEPTIKEISEEIEQEFKKNDGMYKLAGISSSFMGIYHNLYRHTQDYLGNAKKVRVGSVGFSQSKNAYVYISNSGLTIKQFASLQSMVYHINKPCSFLDAMF